MERPRFRPVRGHRERFVEGLATHLMIVQRLDYLDNSAMELALHADELSKMLYQMRRRVLANLGASETETEY